MPASGSGSSGKKARKQKRDSDINPQIEKLLTSVGVVAAIIIVAVLITIFAKLEEFSTQDPMEIILLRRRLRDRRLD